jgi:hypothetical protein
MVRVVDEGSEFEASIQTVWRYMNSGEAHDRVHRSERAHDTKPSGDRSVTVSLERNFRGNWVKIVERLTLLPPLGVVRESQEGPFAGSKSFTVYTSKGPTTRVDVVGEFLSPVLKEPEIEGAVREWLDESFREDAPAVKSLQVSPDP